MPVEYKPQKMKKESTSIRFDNNTNYKLDLICKTFKIDNRSEAVRKSIDIVFNAILATEREDQLLNRKE